MNKNIFLYGWIHPKNKNSLEKYNRINLYTDIKDIEKCEIVYLPSDYIDLSINYPSKYIIYGPHFSVFPDEKYISFLKNYNDKSVYIMPSEWCKLYWDNIVKLNNKNTIEILPFGVDTNKFYENKLLKERNEIFLYYKNRDVSELNYLKLFLKDKNINYTIFNYKSGYDESLYLKTLQNSKFGIILDGHESQGFAIEEALSCNVPLLVWNVSSMKQELNSNYPDISATTIPYWDNRCGEFFYKKEELEDTYNKFLKNLENYKPREFIEDTVSMEKCENMLIDLIKKRFNI